ncbi:MAG: carboxypeptidase-like regulatory domain-containing protein [Cytophagaceae bacterium]
MNKIVFIALLFFTFPVFSQDEAAQNQAAQELIVQFSGLVVGGDSLYGLPGAYVYVPASGRGTTTNYVGYFSMPALAGDSVVVRSLGYQENFFIIPKDGRMDISVVIELSADTTLLPEVEIFPYPTEQIFKEAFLALQLPDDQTSNMQNNLNEQLMRRMLANTPAGANMNHRYFMQQQVIKTENRFMQPTLSLLNPFAWRHFIDQVRRGGLRAPEGED